MLSHLTEVSGRLTGVPSIDPVALLPVVAPVVALLLVLLIDVVRPVRPLLDVVAVAGLLTAAGGVAFLALGDDRSTACSAGFLVGSSPPPTPLNAAELGFGCSYVVSDLTLTVQAIVLAAALGCLLLTLNGPGAKDRTAHHTLLLATVAGATALAGARDLATLTVALETATLPTIGLIALRRDAQGAQAAVTMLLTAVASLGLLLFGVALLFLATGSLYLERIADVLATGPDRPVLLVAVAGTGLALAGIGFKISLVPFHLWTPDTYAGAPLPIAAFLSTVSKTAGLTAAVVLLALGLPALHAAWAPLVGVLAAVTMTVGNLVALRQTVAVRLLAWSTVAQAGWVVLPLAAVGPSRDSVSEAVSASLGYLLAYVVAGLAVFSVVVLVARHHRAGEEHTLEAYRGLGRTEPVASAVLAFALFCLAGLPPGVMGLIAKVVVLRPVVDEGPGWVAVVAALNVALALAYYLRWTALLVGTPEQAPPRWRLRPAEGIVLGGAAAGCVGLSVGAGTIAGLLPGVLQ
ncbi:NADH-quinone oxidoreductase subunit N [Kineosporia succinea]|uniref:NADH-quinone oxidoreductase subunit N n=1 Tax=Kineosporia succinea TaxID=84632 RepID=A0ABT9P4N0_9ACTN|nr:NADH-quinone oxidoreductase subunit N [Kineosporia succinea]MDP9827145.1 NADH-quinone oxidoreductase subunit N [Kineosporia succinea]